MRRAAILLSLLPGLLAPGASRAACPSEVADATLGSPPPRYDSLAYAEMPLRTLTRWQEATTYDRALAVAVGDTGTLEGADTIGTLRTGACQALFTAPGPPSALGGVVPGLAPLAPVTYAPGVPVPVSGVDVTAGSQAGIDGHWSPIGPTGSGGLAFPLPQGVPAGTRAVQLGSPPVGDEPPVAVPGSSPQTLAVRPAVVDVSAGSATLRVQVAPAVIPGQSVAVALISVSGAPAAATFGLTASAPTAELDFPLVPTPARAAYLVVLSVDGVASLPGYANGLLSSPLVSLR